VKKLRPALGEAGRREPGLGTGRGGGQAAWRYSPRSAAPHSAKEYVGCVGTFATGSAPALHYAQESVMEFAATQSNLPRVANKVFCCVSHAEKEIMAKVLKLIFGAAIAVASIATPALAAQKGKPISAHQNGYVTTSSQRSGVYNSVPSRGPSPSCPGLPYCDPATGISYPRGEPGGAGG
jgi:hypothetical protein